MNEQLTAKNGENIFFMVGYRPQIPIATFS